MRGEAAVATSLSGSTGPPIPEPAGAEATGMPFLRGISCHKPSANLSPFPFSVPTNESLVLGDIAGMCYQEELANSASVFKYFETTLCRVGPGTRARGRSVAHAQHSHSTLLNYRLLL